MKPSRLREAALNDIDGALDYYLEHAAHMIEPFSQALLGAQRHIEESPGSGSPRYSGHWSAIGEAPEASQTSAQRATPVLRFWLLAQFPYAIFYVERHDFIDIARVLHQASDIPNHLDN